MYILRTELKLFRLFVLADLNLYFLIFIIEQTSAKLFNRGKLLNIGYLESSKLFSFSCYTFHDIDIFPDKLGCNYTCIRQPRALALYISRWNYTHPWWGTGFGGVSQVTQQHMNKTNGFPNRFYGWGGEDSVMELRLQKAGYKIAEIETTCRMETPKHEHDAGNQASSRSHRRKELKRENKLLPEAISDGISSIEYSIVNQTWKFHGHVSQILVDI